MEYKIGFYNKEVEERTQLEGKCNRVYDDIQGLYRHLREGDTILFNSILSVSLLDSQELRGKVDEFKLKIEFLHQENSSRGANIFTLNTVLAVFDFIREEKEEVKKIIEII